MVAASFVALGERTVVVEVVAKALAGTSRGIAFTTSWVAAMTIVDTAALGAIFSVETSVVHI